MLCRQRISNATTHEAQGKKFTWNNTAEESFQGIKKELCEAPVLGMLTKKGMYVWDTDLSVVAISGILHQEREWNGKTVLRPITYGRKVLSDTEINEVQSTQSGDVCGRQF